MSHGDCPPPISEGDDFPYWKIRMEAYLEALDVGILRAASQGSQNLRMLHTYKEMRWIMRNGMQRLKTPSLEAFAKICLTESGATKTSMHYGWIFMRSMREQRASVRNCRCFVQAPASRFIVMRVRLGWCAKGHKIYTGSGWMSLRLVYNCSCY